MPLVTAVEPLVGPKRAGRRDLGASSDNRPRGLCITMHTEIVGFRRRVVKIISRFYLHAGAVLLYNIGTRPYICGGRRNAFSSRFLAILRKGGLCYTTKLCADRTITASSATRKNSLNGKLSASYLDSSSSCGILDTV